MTAEEKLNNEAKTISEETRTITSEDIEQIKYYHSLLSKSYFPDTEKMQELYNRIMPQPLLPTNCGTCIRNRIMEMYNLVKQIEEETECE